MASVPLWGQGPRDIGDWPKHLTDPPCEKTRVLGGEDKRVSTAAAASGAGRHEEQQQVRAGRCRGVTAPQGRYHC